MRHPAQSLLPLLRLLLLLLLPLGPLAGCSVESYAIDKLGEALSKSGRTFASDDDPQLVAVSASSNRSKGDQDPSTWKPADPASWCVYAEDWVAVKTHWKLTVTTAEKSALADMLEKC